MSPKNKLNPNNVAFWAPYQSPLNTQVKAASSQTDILTVKRRKEAQRQKMAEALGRSHIAISTGMGMMPGMDNTGFTNTNNFSFPVDVLERPQSRREQIEWFFRFYRENPIVRRVIDLHCQLPLAKATLTKPKSSSTVFSDYIFDYFEEMSRRMGLMTKLRKDVSKQYWLQGDSFVFLEDQKMDPDSHPYGKDPHAMDAGASEHENSSSDFFQVNRYINKPRPKKTSSVIREAVKLAAMKQAGMAVPNPEKRIVLAEHEFEDVFSPEAMTYIRSIHRQSNIVPNLERFVDVVSGKRKASVSKIASHVLEGLGPEFLPFDHHLAFRASQRLHAAALLKKAAPTLEPRPEDADEVESMMDDLLDEVSGGDSASSDGFDGLPTVTTYEAGLPEAKPVDVTHVPRNDRSIGATPNKDLQAFLKDNPEVQLALDHLKNPNDPVASPVEKPVAPILPESGPGGSDMGGDLGGDMPAFDLNSPISGLDDQQKKEMMKIYNDNLRKKKELLENLVEEMKQHYQDYLCFANVRYPRYRGWQAMRSLPPQQVEVKRYANTDMFEICYIPSNEEMEQINEEVSKLDERGQQLWKSEKKLAMATYSVVAPSEVTEELPADGSYAVQISNSRADFELYGHSLLEACLRDLIENDKIAQVKSQTLARNMQPKRVVTAEGIDPAELARLQEMVDMSTVDPDFSIVTNYIVQWQEIGAQDRLPVFDAEYSHINENLSAGLAFFNSLVSGETTYGGTKTPQEIMNTMYLAFREDLAEFVEEKIFRPVAERKGFYDVDDFGQKTLIYPKLSFTRLAIRDSGETYDLYLNLYLKGSLSISRLYEILNIDEEEEIQKLEEELFTLRDPKFTDLVSNIYNAAGQKIIENTNIVDVLTENLGLQKQEEQNAEGDDDGLGGLGGGDLGGLGGGDLGGLDMGGGDLGGDSGGEAPPEEGGDVAPPPEA